MVGSRSRGRPCVRAGSTSSIATAPTRFAARRRFRQSRRSSGSRACVSARPSPPITRSSSRLFSRAKERAMTTSTKTAKGWNVLDREGGVLWRQYRFGGPGATATTFVFRGKGDALIVVSPGRHVEADALDELSEFGKVTALVASNSYHWLGQPLWKKHFPDAK